MKAISLVALATLFLSFPAAAQTQPVTASSELQLGVEAHYSALTDAMPSASQADKIIHYEEAIKHFQKAIELDPSLLDARQYLETTLLQFGLFYKLRNRLPEAEHQFKHAIDVDPKSSEPRASLVSVLMQEGKQAQAESVMRQAKKDLSHEEGYRLLGDFYLSTGDLDKATNEYTSLYRDHPDDIAVRKNYIQLLICKNRLDEATIIDNEILKANADDVDALVYKAQVQIRKKDASSAIDSLQSALRNDPDNAVAHYYLGSAFDQQHNEARAESEWREALRLRPDMTDAKRALAAAALKLNRSDPSRN